MEGGGGSRSWDKLRPDGPLGSECNQLSNLNARHLIGISIYLHNEIRNAYLELRLHEPEFNAHVQQIVEPIKDFFAAPYACGFLFAVGIFSGISL